MTGSAAAEVLRFCASYEDLPREDCVIPERCEERACSICGALVHYDPKASIPILGREKIVCSSSTCLEAAMQ